MQTTPNGSAFDWSRMYADSVSDIRDLRDFLNLTEDELADLVAVQEKYPLFVNKHYLSLINVGDPNDPIRRMCIPSVEELDLSGAADTSGESRSTVLPGLQHKYAETALVLSTSQCAMYCRHCFRRRFVGVSHEETVSDIDAVAAYIDEHAEITNVLISGGDALMNSNEDLRRYLELLSQINHVKTIRLGTRIPVVLPERILQDAELIDMLEEFGKIKQLHVVTQFNHYSEVNPASHDAVRSLLRAGIPVRNQTVLLRGVNDSAGTLVRLMNELVCIGVAPYYIFQCRPTTGVKNRFQVPLVEGCNIVEQARSHLNGLAKSFRFIMSHDAGKIEILGLVGKDVFGYAGNSNHPFALFKFHQARDRRILGKLFTVKLDSDTCWLEDKDLASINTETSNASMNYDTRKTAARLRY